MISEQQVSAGCEAAAVADRLSHARDAANIGNCTVLLYHDVLCIIRVCNIIESPGRCYQHVDRKLRGFSVLETKVSGGTPVNPPLRGMVPGS